MNEQEPTLPIPESQYWALWNVYMQAKALYLGHLGAPDIGLQVELIELEVALNRVKDEGVEL